MKTYIISIAMLFSLACCHNHNNTEKYDESDSSHEDEIVFTKEQAEAVGLKIESVVPGIFNQVIKTSGQIQTAQGDEISIVATTNGIVSFTNPSISEGSSVKAGSAIVSISAKNLPEGDPAIKNKTAYEKALKEYLRAQNLVQDKIISDKEFEQIRLRYETAKTTYEAQAGKVSGAGLQVITPINGFIKNKFVNQGDYVSVGQPIATVSQNKRLQLKADVSEKYFKYLKSINSANFKPAYSETVYKLSDLNGRLLSFGKASGQESFYIPILFEFDNMGDIVPGSFAEVYLLAHPQENAISLPKSAITEEQGLYFVYLQLDEEGYQKQEVNLGEDNGERVQILSGLKEGDKVVVKGAYHIKLAASSGVIPEGHSH